MYKKHNANPTASRVGDCVIRAISKVLNKTWEETYIAIAMHGLVLHDMPSANHVWGSYLESIGYKRHIVPSTCPKCYTLRSFADDHKDGSYVMALDGHVVACVDGDYYDTWDSGDEVPLFYWEKES